MATKKKVEEPVVVEEKPKAKAKPVAKEEPKAVEESKKFDWRPTVGNAEKYIKEMYGTCDYKIAFNKAIGSEKIDEFDVDLFNRTVGAISNGTDEKYVLLWNCLLVKRGYEVLRLNMWDENTVKVASPARALFGNLVVLASDIKMLLS